jgi:hypothetical protein
VTRLAWLLADLPVEVLGRLRSDRVMKLPTPPRQPGTNGRPRKHGQQLALADPATWPAPLITTSTVTSRYGRAAAAAWDRVHPRLTHRGAWLDHDGPLPVIEGTLIRLRVDHLPGDRDPKPVWLWCSATSAAPSQVDRLWQAFKQVLGWTAPKIRDPAADRWTWLIIAAHAQLRLAWPLAEDLRLPRERPAPPGRVTPARVRRGFRNIRATLPPPGRCAKTRQARPRTSPRIEKPAPRAPPRRGQTTRRERTLTTRRERTGQTTGPAAVSVRRAPAVMMWPARTAIT